MLSANVAGAPGAWVRMTGMREQDRKPTSRVDGVPEDAPATMAVLRERVDELVAQMGRLDALSERLRTLVDREDAGSALEILREREQVLADVSPLSSWIERQWARVPASKRDRELGGKLGAIEQMAARIASRDREDMTRLERAAGRVADELAGLSRAGQAGRAYGSAPATGDASPRFQDREA